MTFGTLLKISYIYIQQPGFPDQNGEPGCLVKEKTSPKTNRFVGSYLTVSNLMIFKPLKIRQKFVKKC